MRILGRPILPAARRSRDPRVEQARTVELRRALRTGSVLVAVVLVLTGFALGARYPIRAVPFFLLWTSGGIACCALYIAAGRSSQRMVVPLTVLLTGIPATLLLGTAVEARALLTISSGFTMLPVAVPLFLAWHCRVRTVWLLAYAAVYGSVILATGFGHLAPVDRIDLATNVMIGVFFGWIGGELLERMRARTLDQEIELRRLNLELQIRATTDALTGLANRRQLDTDLEILSASRLGGAGTCAFIMLDLDHFKRLNDELGHAAGDDALRLVSSELARVIRERDRSYRYGGEEFLVIMPDASLDAAAAAAERIRTGIADLQIRAGARPDAGHLTISGGVAFSLNAREHWEEVLAAADSALYRAKAAGRDQICVAPAVVHQHSATSRREGRRSADAAPPERLGPVDLAG